MEKIELNTILTTNCECMNWDDDGTTGTPADYCSGWCWDDMQQDTIHLLTEWQHLNNNPEALKISGAGMSWQRLSGYAIVRGSAGDELSQEVINSLKINGDFILRFRLDGNTLTITRSSHDEPTGATFTLQPIQEDGRD